MTLTEQLAAVDATVDRRSYDDHVEIVADFGPDGEATVDIVDGTAIVVSGDDQYDLPVEGEAEAFMRNGVLTIEVSE